MITINPIAVVIKTKIDLSLLFIIPITPVTKADIADIPATIIGIVRQRLLKKLSPPLCPEATRTRNVMNNTMKMTNSQIDQLPKQVFGKIYDFTRQFYASVYTLSIQYIALFVHSSDVLKLSKTHNCHQNIFFITINIF